MRSARVILLGGVSAMATAVGLMTTVPAWAQPASVPHWGNTGTTSTHLTTPDGNGNPAMTKSTRMTMNQGGGGTALARDIQIVRQATAKYATNLAKAKADGYQIITKMMPGMGFHYLNPNIPGFSLRKPQILVYEHIGTGWQLGAVEWIFPKQPKNAPFPFGTFGSFPAACHYKDGTFVVDENAKTCPKTAPKTGAKFNFWHPDLVTLHAWVWYPNRAGLFASTNPDIAPFNGG
jgi:hypothetical protein